MTLPVSFTYEASTQVETIERWWREHRPASPGLFVQELAEAVELPGTLPGAGRTHARTSSIDIRRIPLRATRYHVYHVIGNDGIVILAVWSAVRGHGPRFAP